MRKILKTKNYFDDFFRDFSEFSLQFFFYFFAIFFSFIAFFNYFLGHNKNIQICKNICMKKISRKNRKKKFVETYRQNVENYLHWLFACGVPIKIQTANPIILKA